MPCCVLIPAYQAAASVGDVVRRARRHVPDVIVINDGSVDGTGDAARQAGATVLDHPLNLGKGQALRTGLRHAYRHGFRHAVTLDADGQHDPDDLPGFVAALRDHPGSLVVGTREMERGGAPAASRFGRWLTNLWVWIDGGVRVGDAQSGYRAYPVPETLGLGLQGGRFEFEMEVIVRAMWARIPVRSIPIGVRYEEVQRAGSHFHPLVDNVRITLLLAYLFVLRLLPPLRRRPAALPWPPPEDPGTPGAEGVD